ncbi:GMC family oxidoreductase [Rubellimicrobium rubrum]|uniref:GMC family oxidoreductase n=1 Tax=Rubellimicrobium rubrum TaxID=2585369 RepID=A0A5C4N4G2_9RHOB|nr:GMC family oxidoreductase [Rubellimicrobium rubrum]TNC51486.1 GMC family oxidoreductase [Rubellimicrobium rubrum]
MARDEYDYIVVGGGAAGCVAAARLVNPGGHRVLLLEGGYSHRHPLLDMPPGIFKMINGSKFMHYHTTPPQDHLGGRAHDIPQGNVLGGGTSVNAQVYMRGRPSDYEEWNDVLRGNNDGADWSWSAVLRHMRRMEDNNRLYDDFHNVDGPLQVSDPGHIDQISRWFVQAVQGMGEPYNPDFNGTSQRGVGFYQFMNRHGKRSSAAYAFIAPLEKDPRLTLKLEARAERVLIEQGRAVGVVWRDKAGQEQKSYARGEVVLAAGALITPKLLMLSGVGPADHLREHGLPVLQDAPGVGQNLVDHPEVPIIATANGKYGYYGQGEGWRMIKHGLHFKIFGTGVITSAGVEAGAFVNPSDPTAEPTIQAFCVPIVYLDRDLLKMMKNTHGMTITTVVVKPRSRGWVKLRSANPADKPIVSPNLLKDPEDMRQMVEGQRFFLQAFGAEPLKSRIREIKFPDPARLDDESLAAHCRKMVKTNYHPASTARMGADGDPMAVLDARMRVRGIEGLRVADMSACPNINAGNTTAPALMLGSRCADFVMGLE